MRIHYDKNSDAAYLELQASPRLVTKTYCCEPNEVNGQINLDFDVDGRLLGIEILDASRLLPQVLLGTIN